MIFIVFNIMFLLADLVTTNVTHVELSHPATESYMSFETHKCAAVAHAQYQLFALFPPTVPNHSMRSVLWVPPTAHMVFSMS